MGVWFPLLIYVLISIVTWLFFPSIFLSVGIIFTSAVSFLHDIVNAQPSNIKENVYLVVFLALEASLIHIITISYYRLKFRNDFKECLDEKERSTYYKNEVKKVAINILISVFLSIAALVSIFHRTDLHKVDVITEKTLSSFLVVAVVCYLVTGSILSIFKYLPFIKFKRR